MKKFFNFRLALLYSFSVSLGIFSAYLFKFEYYLGFVLASVSFLVIATCFLFFTGKFERFKLFSVTLSIVVFAIGFFGFYRVVNSYEKANLNGNYYTIQGKITSVSPTDYGSRFILSDVTVKGSISGKTGYKIALYVYGQSELDIGDYIRFESYLKDKPSIYEGRLASSDIEREIKYMANVNTDEILVVGRDLNVFEKANLFIRDSLKGGLEEKQFNVAYAMLTGYSDFMEEDVITSYRAAGVAHIFAVSGLHIGFLAAALTFLFKKLKINRTVKAIVITLTLFFYSGICGFSASSIRASIMCSVALFCKVFGKKYDGLTALCIAFVLILLFAPIQLFCVGFQLSFAVVLGIILLGPPIAKWFNFLPKKLAFSLGSVIAAQVVGIPICLAAFGKFSTIAIFINLIFIPVVGVLFIALILLTFLGGIFAISHITLFLPNLVLKVVTAMITAFDFELFMVGGFKLSIFVLFFYLAVFLPCGLFNLSKLTKAVCFIVCSCTCIVGSVVVNVNKTKEFNVYVIGSDTVCATVLSLENENVLIISSVNAIWSASRLERLSIQTGIDEFDCVILTSGCVADMQNVTTKLFPKFTINRLCYFGEQDKKLETVIKKSFNIEAVCYGNGDRLPVDNFDCAFDLDGNVVRVSKNDVNLAVFSRFGKYNAGYVDLKFVPNLIIAFDYCENIYKEYDSVRTVSYLKNSLLEDAYSNGTLNVKFSEISP